MRVTFLTHYYPPEIGAAASRIAALAHCLAARGIDVTVHTGAPHYPSGVVPPPYRNALRQAERDGSVRIVRSLVYPAPNRGVVRRLADHSVLALSTALTAGISGPADVVVAETPPLFMAAAGAAYAARKRAPLVLNVSDLWPRSAVELGVLRHRPVIAAATALEHWCYRRAAAITAPTAGIVARLSDEPTARGKVVAIPPAVDLERFAVVPPPPGGALRVVYAGVLGMAQGAGVLLDAARIAGADGVELTIAGDGPDAALLRRRVAEERLGNVRLLGTIAPERVPQLYAEAHAGVVPLRDLPILAGALPTKLFEIFAAGRPAVVAAWGEAAQLVERERAGLAVAPQDAAALAAAFKRLRDDPVGAGEMGERGRAAAARYDRGHAADRWTELLERVASPPRRRTAAS